MSLTALKTSFEPKFTGGVGDDSQSLKKIRQNPFKTKGAPKENNKNDSDAQALRFLLDEMQGIISKYAARYLEDNLKNDFFRQLEMVLDPNDWATGDTLPNVDSLKSLTKFILNAQPVNAPFLGVSNSGNFLAFWENKGSELTIEFCPMDCAKWFVAFEAPEKKECTSGNTGSLKRLIAVMQPFSDAHWFTRI